MMKKILCILLIAIMAIMLTGCDMNKSSQSKEQKQQEEMQKESIAQVGTPAIANFREKRLLKQIYELRDQDGLLTYTYIVAEQTGKLVFIGETIGYGIPASTQFNNPEKLANGYHDSTAIPQAEPNGLYSPSSAEGTWIMLKDASGKTVKPVYVEPRIIVSPFKLDI